MEDRKPKIISRRAARFSEIIFLLVAIAVFIPACVTPAKQIEVERALEALRPRARELGSMLLTREDTDWFAEYEAERKNYGKQFADMGKEAVPYIAARFLEIDSKNPYIPYENHFYHGALSEALYIIGHDAVPYLVKGIRSGKGRIYTALLLARIGAEKELRELYENSAGEIKTRVATGLCVAGDTDALLYLLDTVEPLPGQGAVSPTALVEDDELQQAYAISNFWMFCQFTEKQIDVLQSVLTGPDGKRKENAWPMLGYMAFLWREQAIPILERLMDDPDENVRASAATCIGHWYRHPRIVELTIRAFSDLSEKVRSAGRLPGDIRVLLALLEIRDFDLRAKVKECLSHHLIASGDETTKIVYSNPWTKALVDSVDLPRGKAAIEMLQKDIQSLSERAWTADYNALMIAQAIAEGGKEMIEQLVPLLKKPGAEEEWHAFYFAYIVVNALILVDEERAVFEIISVLKEDDEKVTKPVWWALLSINSEKIDDALLTLAKEEKNPTLREKAIRRLPTEMADQLIQLFDTERDSAVRRAIASRLADFTSPSAAPVLRKALANVNAAESKESAEFASKILDALARLAIAEDRPLFLSMLKSDLPNMRKAAIKGLALIGNKDDVPVLGKLLKEDKDKEMRCACAAALGRIGTDDAIKLLIESLSDKDVRLACAEALAQLGRKEAIEVLFEELKNPSLFPPLYAAYALTLFSAEEVLPYADKFLTKPDRELILASEWLLTWFGDTPPYFRFMTQFRTAGNTSIAASAALARQGDLLAAEVGIYDLSASFNLRAYAQLVRLFPDAPQIDYYRLSASDYACRKEAVDKFLAWWETNRFNLKFDEDKQVFKLIIPNYQKPKR